MPELVGLSCPVAPEGEFLFGRGLWGLLNNPHKRHSEGRRSLPARGICFVFRHATQSRFLAALRMTGMRVFAKGHDFSRAASGSQWIVQALSRGERVDAPAAG